MFISFQSHYHRTKDAPSDVDTVDVLALREIVLVYVIAMGYVWLTYQQVCVLPE